jgi:hypothetical protein
MSSVRKDFFRRSGNDSTPSKSIDRLTVRKDQPSSSEKDLSKLIVHTRNFHAHDNSEDSEINRLLNQSNAYQPPRTIEKMPVTPMSTITSPSFMPHLSETDWKESLALSSYMNHHDHQEPKGPYALLGRIRTPSSQVSPRNQSAEFEVQKSRLTDQQHQENDREMLSRSVASEKLTPQGFYRKMDRLRANQSLTSMNLSPAHSPSPPPPPALSALENTQPIRLQDSSLLLSQFKEKPRPSSASKLQEITQKYSNSSSFNRFSYDSRAPSGSGTGMEGMMQTFQQNPSFNGLNSPTSTRISPRSDEAGEEFHVSFPWRKENHHGESLEEDHKDVTLIKTVSNPYLLSAEKEEKEQEEDKEFEEHLKKRLSPSAASPATSPTTFASTMDVMGLKLLLKTALRDKENVSTDLKELKQQFSTMDKENSLLKRHVEQFHSYVYFGKKYHLIFVCQRLFEKKTDLSISKKFLLWKNKTFHEKYFCLQYEFQDKVKLNAAKVFNKLKKLLLLRSLMNWKKNSELKEYSLLVKEITFQKYFQSAHCLQRHWKQWKLKLQQKTQLRKVLFYFIVNLVPKKRLSLMKWKSFSLIQLKSNSFQLLKKQLLTKVVEKHLITAKKDSTIAFLKWKFYSFHQQANSVIQWNRFASGSHLMNSFQKKFRNKFLVTTFSKWKNNILLQGKTNDLKALLLSKMKNTFTKLMKRDSFLCWKSEFFTEWGTKRNFCFLFYKKLILQNKQQAFQHWKRIIFIHLKDQDSQSKEVYLHKQLNVCKQITHLLKAFSRKRKLKIGFQQWKLFNFSSKFQEKYSQQSNYLQNNLSMMTSTLSEKQQMISSLNTFQKNLQQENARKLKLFASKKLFSVLLSQQMTAKRLVFQKWFKIHGIQSRNLLLRKEKTEKLKLFVLLVSNKSNMKKKLEAFQLWKRYNTVFQNLFQSYQSVRKLVLKNLFLKWKQKYSKQMKLRLIMKRQFTLLYSKQLSISFHRWSKQTSQKSREKTVFIRFFSLVYLKKLKQSFMNWYKKAHQRKEFLIQDYSYQLLKTFRLKKNIFSTWKKQNELKNRLSAFFKKFFYQKPLKTALKKWKEVIFSHQKALQMKFMKIIMNVEHYKTLKTQRKFFLFNSFMKWKRNTYDSNLVKQNQAYSQKLSLYHQQIHSISDKQNVIEMSNSQLIERNNVLLTKRRAFLQFYLQKRVSSQRKWFLLKLFHSWKLFVFTQKNWKNVLKKKNDFLQFKSFERWKFLFLKRQKKTSYYFQYLTTKNKLNSSHFSFLVFNTWKVYIARLKMRKQVTSNIFWSDLSK